MKFSVVEFYWKLPSFSMLSLSSVLWPIIIWLAWALSFNNILYFSYNIFARGSIIFVAFVLHLIILSERFVVIV